MACPELSFLVLSDIHFGHLAEHQDFALPGTNLVGHLEYAVSMRRNLTEAITATGQKIDVILAPGDLTSAACPCEFQACWRIIEDIADELNVSRDRIFCTYGNHDCNWRISRLSDGDGSFVADNAFRHIASCVGEYFCVSSAPLTRGPLPGSGVLRSAELDVFIANSGYFCSHDQALKHGKLGHEQFEWLRGELTSDLNTDRWRVVMLHHHSYNYPYPSPIHDLTFLEEGDALVHLLGTAHVDLVCHGHRHHPILNTRIDAGWVSPVTFMCAGSVAVNSEHRAAGHIPNLFHIVTLEQKHPHTKAALGRVRTFRFTIPHGWVPNTEASDTVPFDAVHCFGSVLSQHQLYAEMAQVLNTSLQASGERFVCLPQWDQLPLDLRYTTLQSTNQALSSAAEAVHLELFARYPSQPIVVRSTP